MVRVVRIVVVGHVARRAGRTGQVVVAIYVTLRARCAYVHSGQRKTGGRVIKGGLQPRHGVVADGAVRGESRLRVVRVRGAVVVLHVALIARATGQVVVVVDVTLRTLQSRMSVCQRKSDRVVIEARRLPRAGAVAGLA